jgi:hypothetical protein
MLRLLGNGTTVMDLEAQVQLNSAGHQISWKAKVERVGDAIDSRTQSASVVVRVDDSQAQATAGQRPPLRRNMFVEVLLLGKQLEVLAVPVEAVRDNVALLVSAGGQLEKRNVSVGFVMGNLAVIDSGLSPGDQIVVTSPTIAVPGMAVSAVEDEERKAALMADAAGRPAATGGDGGRVVGGGAGAGNNSNSGADGNESNSDTRVTGQ